MTDMNDLEASLQLYLQTLLREGLLIQLDRVGEAIAISTGEAIQRVFRNLPKDADIATLDELEDLLVDLVNSSTDDQLETPGEAERLFLSLLTKTDYKFRVPIVRLGAGLPTQEIGGRLRLSLERGTLEKTEFLFVNGTVNCSHWRSARRTAMRTLDEISGCLLATGLLRFTPKLQPTGLIGTVPLPRVELSVAMPEAEGRWADDFLLSWSQIHDIWSSVLSLPSELTDLERHALENSGPEEVLLARLKLAMRPFSLGGQYARKLRTAARFLRRAETAEEPGDSYLYMATCLEGLLVEGKDEVSARLRDAVAFLLGNSHEQRKTLRDEVGHLYDVRSRYIHEGEYTGDVLRKAKSMRIVKEVVEGELRRFTADAK